MSLVEGRKTLLLVGAGNMGEAMLRSWVLNKVNELSLFVLEPNPSDWLKSVFEKGLVVLNPKRTPKEIDICIFAVKPQTLEEVLGKMRQKISKRTLIISIVAVKNFRFFQSIFKFNQPLIRVMPNTPVEINQGISAIVADQFADHFHIKCVEELFDSLGETVLLRTESEIDAVTAISGSGPAYIFNLIENLIESAKDLGLTSKLSKKLIIQTIVGAGILAGSSKQHPGKLREKVTSPAGTTEAALNVLMHKKLGWGPIIAKAVHAAHNRSKELAGK